MDGDPILVNLLKTYMSANLELALALVSSTVFERNVTIKQIAELKINNISDIVVHCGFKMKVFVLNIFLFKN